MDQARFETSFFPVMGERLDSANSFVINLSKDNGVLANLNLTDSAAFSSYVDRSREEANKPYAIGGYLEDRMIYTRSPVFAMDSALFRTIHLGIDIWSLAGTLVFCPLDGTIHSLQDNAGFGNYGPTVIVEHQLRGLRIYSLYGHLAKSDLMALRPGKYLSAGDVIGRLGIDEENGNWPAHLHFQLINDMEGRSGDYPGVCGSTDLPYYAANCPDPNIWLNCPLLRSRP